MQVCASRGHSLIISHINTDHRLNLFQTACKTKWNQAATDTCGETQTMSFIDDSYPLTKENSGLSQLLSVDNNSLLGWPVVYMQKE